MAYRLRYQYYVDWVPPGVGVLSGNVLTSGVTSGASAQSYAQDDTSPGQNSLTFTAADITALTNAMAADVAAQLNAPATIARIQAFATGGG
jgi:hypothetical protein